MADRQMTNQELYELSLTLAAPRVDSNFFGARQGPVADLIERAFIEARVATMPPAFRVEASVDGLQTLHRYLLQDVYPRPKMWDRTRRHDEGMAREIDNVIDGVDRDLKRFAGPVGRRLGDKAFGAELGKLMAVLTVTPVVEPPELTNSLFLDRLAAKAGHPIDWGRIDQGAMFQATLAMYARNDTRPMQAVFADAVAKPSLAGADAPDRPHPGAPAVQEGPKLAP
jgi:fido (protein-threonine AMPylation protein)